jgi:hypothetical protein
MIWAIGAIACYLGVGAVRASCLDRTRLVDGYRQGHIAATGTEPTEAQETKVVKAARVLYTVFWLYDDAARCIGALRRK